MAITFVFTILSLSALGVRVAASPVQPRQSITALGPDQINAFSPFTHFAAAGYCAPSQTSSWSCGAHCDATRGFIPVASGGDGSSVQFWFVGYSPAQNSVIVSHQGTDPSQIEPLLTDANPLMTTLDSTLFPGMSTSIKVHEGFAGAQAKAATQVLAAVQRALSDNHASRVTVVGHSLGAAIAILDSVYLKLHLPSSVKIVTVGYGQPRVGNSSFANYVDANLSLTHINNQKDPIPIVPGRGLGYAHSNGEVHIDSSGAWQSCPGHDNTSTQCSVGTVPNLFAGDISNHDGPYNGIEMGC